MSRWQRLLRLGGRFPKLRSHCVDQTGGVVQDGKRGGYQSLVPTLLNLAIDLDLSAVENIIADHTDGNQRTLRLSLITVEK